MIRSKVVLIVAVFCTACGSASSEPVSLPAADEVREDVTADESSERPTTTARPLPPTTLQRTTTTIEKDATPSDAAVEVLPAPSDTIFPPPQSPPPEEFVVPSDKEMNQVADSPEGRKTLVLTKSADGNDVWVTAWSQQTSSGAWVYCVGSSHYGLSCTPDSHGVDGFQIASFGVEGPDVVTFIAESHVEQVEVWQSESTRDRTKVQMTDLGLPSGYRFGALLLEDAPSDVLYFAGTDRDERKQISAVRIPGGASGGDGEAKSSSAPPPGPTPAYAPTELG